MNYSVVKLLIQKNWYLQRRAIAWSLAAAVAFGITLAAEKAALFLGITLIVTIMVTIGVVLVMSTVVERKEQTLCFIKSLPISSRE